MGEADAEDQDDKAVLDPRTIRPTMHGHKNWEMDAIGWIIFIGLFLLIIPLIPGVLIVLLLAKLVGIDGRKSISWGNSQLPPKALQ